MVHVPEIVCGAHTNVCAPLFMCRCVYAMDMSHSASAGNVVKCRCGADNRVYNPKSSSISITDMRPRG